MQTKLELTGWSAPMRRPQIGLYRVDDDDAIVAKLDIACGERIAVPPEARGSLALGPDGADVVRTDPRLLLRLDPAGAAGAPIVVPEAMWRRWFWSGICLRGVASRLPDPGLEPARLAAIALGHAPARAAEALTPWTEGVVEAWVAAATFPADLAERMGETIDTLAAFLTANPLLFPAPAPVTAAEAASLRARVAAAEQAGPVAPRFVPNPALGQHLAVLVAATPAEAAAHVLATPCLWPFAAALSVVQCAETTLTQEGAFSVPLHTMPVATPRVRTAFFYRLKRKQDGGVRVLYDGLAAHELYTADQTPNLIVPERPAGRAAQFRHVDWVQLPGMMHSVLWDDSARLVE